MKKFFVLFLALTFVLSMGTLVIADDGGADSVRSHMAGTHVIIGGDARVEGVWHNNYQPPGTGDTDGNFDKNDDYDSRYWRQRLRLIVNATVGNGIEMRSRISTDNDQWHGTYYTAGYDSAHSRTESGVLEVDYMYLHVPVGNFVIDTGLMRRSWGNKLLLWDSQRDTFQVTTNLGDTQLGLFTDKVEESNDNFTTATTDDNLDDNDNYGVFVNHTAGDLAAGLIVIYEDYNVDDSNTNNTPNRDETGLEASVYFNTTVGAIGIAAEVAHKSGELGNGSWADYNEDGDDHNMLGAFISASTEVGAIGLTASIAMAQDGFVADSHFTPTVFVGTDQNTAIFDFGAMTDATTMGYVIGASTAITSDLSASAKIGYYDIEKAGYVATDKDASLTEVDAGLTYKLADNAAYTVDFGYAMPDDFTAQDDPAMALTHKIEVAF